MFTAAGASVVETLLGTSPVFFGVVAAVGADEDVGVGECAGGETTADFVGVGVAAVVEPDDYTVMRPWPVRTPSVAVTFADLFAVYAADADAGVLAGRRSEKDEPDTVTSTVTSVRLAKRTQPPLFTNTEDTLKVRF